MNRTKKTGARKKPARKTTRKRSRKPARAKSRRNTSGSLPGWAWLSFGLAIGLAVAMGIYVNDRNKLRRLIQDTQPVPITVEKAPPKPVQAEEEEEDRFAFYDLLPNFEVVIPEEDLEVQRNAPDTQVEAAGPYVLQAGSFSRFADADRMKAQLALLGMVAGVQRVTVDDKSYHRVRIGPMTDLDTLNDYRSRLRRADIEALIIRVPE
jgi:cell division protein FtsN